MGNANTQPTYSELMANVGLLLVRWGFLENAMRQSNKPVSDLSRNPELLEARRIRNLIAHGICGAHADPTALAEPSVSCVAQDGTIVEISYRSLAEATAALERYRIENFRPAPPR
jgi:hypothetical protein